MKKQKANSHEGITWSEMGRQNVQAKEVYWNSILVNAHKNNVLFLLNFQPFAGPDVISFTVPAKSPMNASKCFLESSKQLLFLDLVNHSQL